MFSPSIYKTVLVIGATGMLGRPVVRRLVREGIPVRAFVRDVDRAKLLLPSNVTLANGDLESIDSIDSALEGVQAVYISVDTRPKSQFRAETDGLRNLMTALKNHPDTRLLVLSALGASKPEAKTHPYGYVREKAEAQAIIQASSLNWTIFEPVWFMESLPLCCRNGSALGISGLNFNSRWISGDDYGRMIANAINKNLGHQFIIPVQGPETVDFKSALLRFVAAYDPTLKIKNVPAWILNGLGFFIPDVKKLMEVIKLTANLVEPEPIPALWDAYGKPRMKIENYAASIRETNDFPQKSAK